MKLRKRFFKKEKSTFKLLNQSLEARRKELLAEFEDKHQDIVKWLSSKGIAADKILAKTTKGALVGVAAGAVMLSSGILPEAGSKKIDYSTPDLEAVSLVSELSGKTSQDSNLAKALKEELPRNISTLKTQDEKSLSNIVSQILGVKATPELGGFRLNTSYGRIGLEQHLPRYKGEQIQEHLDTDPAQSRYGRSGMTQNRGAFGYFARDKQSLTQAAIDQERYYVVVQTFDIPGYSRNPAWFKNRKVVVINPENGRAVIGDIADSGPAKWTGKNYGGSPELMDHLGMYPGEKKTKVLVFFIDDKDNSVKLGPI